MNDDRDYVWMARAVDSALVKQGRLWQSFVSRRANVDEVDWAEEFYVLVQNRLAKLKRQGVLSRVCQPDVPLPMDEGLREIERVIDAIRRGSL